MHIAQLPICTYYWCWIRFKSILSNFAK